MKKKKIKVQEVSQEVKQEVNQVKESQVKDSSDKPKKKKKKQKASEEDKESKEVATQEEPKVIVKESVTREVKYIYPEDVKDSLAKKTWRQKTRNEIHRLELAVSRIKDTNSKEFKKAMKELTLFKDSVLKPKQ